MDQLPYNIIGIIKKTFDEYSNEDNSIHYDKIEDFTANVLTKMGLSIRLDPRYSDNTHTMLILNSHQSIENVPGKYLLSCNFIYKLYKEDGSIKPIKQRFPLINETGNS